MELASCAIVDERSVPRLLAHGGTIVFQRLSCHSARSASQVAYRLRSGLARPLQKGAGVLGVSPLQ